MCRNTKNTNSKPITTKNIELYLEFTIISTKKSFSKIGHSKTSYLYVFFYGTINNLSIEAICFVWGHSLISYCFCTCNDLGIVVSVAGVLNNEMPDRIVGISTGSPVHGYSRPREGGSPETMFALKEGSVQTV